MRVSIDWFDFLDNKTCSAHCAFTDVVTLPQARAWLKNVVQSMHLDYRHTGQVVVDGYNREDLKAELFCMRTFIVSRKLYEHKDNDDPQYYEYWNGDKSWVDYKDAKHYDSKDEAMEVAKAVAYGREFYHLTEEVVKAVAYGRDFCYLVEEVDEYGFVVMTYEV